MKVTKKIVIEGDEPWVEGIVTSHFPDGKQDILSGRRSITISLMEETRLDERVVDSKDLFGGEI